MLITIYVGANDKETKKQILTDAQIKDAINETVKSFFDGYSLSEITGYFKHEDGTTVIEKSFKVEIFPYLSSLTSQDKLQANLKTICTMLKVFLNQESILLSIQEDVKTFFI